MPRRTACIGNLTHDFIFRVPALPLIDDVAFVYQDTTCLGGRGAIVALVLGRLGLEVDLVTVLPMSQQYGENLSFLQGNNVSTTAVYVDQNASSHHTAYIAVSDADRNCITFFQHSDAHFVLTEEQQRIANAADVLYFTAHAPQFNMDLMATIDTAQKRIVHNASPYLFSDRRYRSKMLSSSWCLIFNEIEGEELLRTEELQSPSDLFSRSDSLGFVIKTRGEDGCVLYTQSGEERRFPAQPCAVRTPVGAGDAFAAGVVYSIAYDLPIEEGIRIGTSLASISVSSETSYPDLDRIMSSLET